MNYLYAFIIGGILCVIAQILIDKTKLTPGKILVTYVCAGVVLTAVGLYGKIVDVGSTGATVPLTGFGYALANGIKEAVDKNGMLGIITGGMTATAAGVTAAVCFAVIWALIFKAKNKND